MASFATGMLDFNILIAFIVDGVEKGSPWLRKRAKSKDENTARV